MVGITGTASPLISPKTIVEGTILYLICSVLSNVILNAGCACSTRELCRTGSKTGWTSVVRMISMMQFYVYRRVHTKQGGCHLLLCLP